MMKLNTLLVAGLLLYADVSMGEEELRRGEESWLGYASKDRKSFTPCGGYSEAVGKDDKIEKSDRKCDGRTAYEPPEKRYAALFEQYNRSVGSEKVKVSFATPGDRVRPDARSLVVTRGGMSALPRTAKSVPFAIEAVVPIYNVPGIAARLQFSPEILAGIFSGQITSWDDPVIAGTNPTVGLADLQILPVRRSGNGTSVRIIGAYVGSAQKLDAPRAVVLKSDSDIVDFVKKTPGAIGFVNMMEAFRTGATTGAVKNASGRFVSASGATLLAAAESASGDALDLAGASGADAYPLATYAFVAFTDDAKSRGGAAMHWLTNEGRERAQELGLTPLPTSAQRDRPRPQQ